MYSVIFCSNIKLPGYFLHREYQANGEWSEKQLAFIDALGFNTILHVGADIYNLMAIQNPSSPCC